MVKNAKGFTVLEIIIVVGISVFIAAATYGVLATGRRTWLAGEALLASQQPVRFGIDKMVRELHHSTVQTSHSTIHQVTVRADNQAVTFNIPLDADGNGWLDLDQGNIVYGAEDAGDFDNDGVLWETGWIIEYQIDTTNKQIIRRVLDDTSAEASREIIANNISALNFQTESGGTGVPDEAVNITLTSQIDTIKGKTIKPPLQTTLRSRVNLRN